MSKLRRTMYALLTERGKNDLFSPGYDDLGDAGGVIFSTPEGAQAMQEYQRVFFAVKTVIVKLHVTVAN